MHILLYRFHAYKAALKRWRRHPSPLLDLPLPVELILEILELSLPSGPDNWLRRTRLLADYSLFSHFVYCWARPLLLFSLRLEPDVEPLSKAFMKAAKRAPQLGEGVRELSVHLFEYLVFTHTNVPRILPRLTELRALRVHAPGNSYHFKLGRLGMSMSRTRNPVVVPHFTLQSPVQDDLPQTPPPLPHQV